jgi:uncharacterized membrane-anchored protein YitT (DUF2179 family)
MKKKLKLGSQLLIAETKHYILILVGILVASFGLKSFLLPNNFIDGGVTGISLLISELTTIPLSILVIAINLPFVILGYRLIGKLFGLKTLLGIILLAISLHIIQFPVVTHDKLLVGVFGGFFLGVGIGLCVRGGGVIDGTEVLALFMTRKISITIGDIILLINVLIFGCAAFLLSVETALYSMLTYFVASKTVDFIINGIEEYIGVTIISTKSEKIRRTLTMTLGKGVTIYKGKSGYARDNEHSNEIDILFTVVTRLEITRLKNEIAIIDDKAFVIQQNINDTKGGMIKKRPLSH